MTSKLSAQKYKLARGGAAAMSDAWYYAEGDQAVGPVTLADLEKRLSLVSNAKDVLVWRAGFPNWQRADSVSDLALLPTPKPPAIPRPLHRRIARGLWINLLGPLLAGGSVGAFFLREERPRVTEDKIGSELVARHAELIGRVTLMWSDVHRRPLNYFRTFVRLRRHESDILKSKTTAHNGNYFYLSVRLR
jgi:hypothetical protein